MNALTYGILIGIVTSLAFMAIVLKILSYFV